MNLNERIARLRNKHLMVDLFKWPSRTHVEATYDSEGIPHFMRRPNIVREPSKNELTASKTQRDIFKCVHGKHYFTPCAGCKRTQLDADKWLKFYEEKTAKLRKDLGIA